MKTFPYIIIKPPLRVKFFFTELEKKVSHTGIQISQEQCYQTVKLLLRQCYLMFLLSKTIP
jgi:hypothetical protein